MSAIEVEHLTKRYCHRDVVDDVTFRIDEGGIHGLLGRNGAGKTTVLRLITGQDRASAGRIRVLGADPFENDHVLRQTCFVKESQAYPDLSVRQVLDAARLLQPRWDEEFAGALVGDFDLPLGRRVKKLSRGMRSALGIVVGLASRAPLTLFDEPYLGLDAPSRRLFYDRLLADYAEHPRTLLLSTHLIDEVANLLERVLVIDRGRLVLDAATDDVRGTAFTVTGSAVCVDRLVGRRPVLRQEAVAGFTTTTVGAPPDPADRSLAAELGLELTSVSLQQLVGLAAEGASR